VIQVELCLVEHVEGDVPVEVLELLVVYFVRVGEAVMRHYHAAQVLGHKEFIELALLLVC